MSNFTGVSAYYHLYRPGIPEAVADLLIAEANRDSPATTLLDLGTGTGQVVEALHEHFRDIIAVDPDREMLQTAETYLRKLIGHDTVLRFFQCEAEKFAPPPDWFASLITISRAFHWMEQPLLLARLSEYVSPTGLIAIFGDRSFWRADNEWKKAVRDVIQSFLGKQRRAGNGIFAQHNRPYNEILKESPFKCIDELTITVHRTWTIESVIGYLYSTSFAARHLFGERIDNFEGAIQAALKPYLVSDLLEEENEFVIYVGRKR